MRKHFLRGVVIPSVLAVIFVVLDLLMDRHAGGAMTLNVPHMFFASLVVLTVFFSMRWVFKEQIRREQAEQRARTELEDRVRERTAELHLANEQLQAEVAERERVELALRDSRQIERALMDASPDSALLIDARGSIWAANEPAARRLGTTVEAMIGVSMFDLFRSEVLEGRRALLEQVVRTGAPVQSIEETSQGTMALSIHPVLDADGKVALLAAFGRDITEQRRAEKALRENEERYRELFDNFPEPVTIWSREGVLLMLNLVSGRNLGGRREDFLGKTITELWGIEAGGGYHERMLRAIETGELVMQEDVVVLGGETRTFQTVTQRVRGLYGDAYAAQVISYEITERKRAEQLARQAQLERAETELERTAQEERQRLARELHDSVSQALYGISLGANTALKLHETDRARTLEALEYVVSLAHTALMEMRAVIFELRPESLETEGLAAALRHQATAIRARHGLEVELSLCQEPDLPLPVKEALYRVAQEALHNAAKHAFCEKLALRLSCDEGPLRLEVVDDGVGFDPTADYPGHLGLRSMRERMERVGGTLEIESAPGEGTRIRVRV